MTTDTAQLTKTSRDGRTVVVTRDGLRCDVDIDGVRHITNGHASNMEGTPFGEQHGVARLIRGTATGRRFSEKTRAVGLTLDEAERLGLIAAEDTARAEYESRPQVRRNRLVSELRMAHYGHEELRTAAIEGDDGNWDYGPERRAEERIKAARQALAAFDREHPEVKAAADAERRRSQELADRLND